MKTKAPSKSRQLHLEYLPLATIKKWPRNPKRHDLATLTKSIGRFGYVSPMIVNEASGELLAGHGRLEALEAQRQAGGPPPKGVKANGDGDWLVPVVRGVSLTEKEAAAYAVADNRLVEIGGWADDMLAEVLKGIDLEGVGYSQADLDELLSKLIEPKSGLIGDDELPEKVETICKAGDLWQLGGHRLLCGDATKQEDVERLMGEEKADMVFTDPPYGVNYNGGTKVRKKLAGDETADLYLPALRIISLSSGDKVVLYLWFAERAGKPVFDALMTSGWEIRAMLIWNKNLAQYGALSAQYHQKHEAMLYCHKKNETPNWYGGTTEVTVWDCARASVNEYHPTQKPVALAERAINNSSQLNQIVLDLFGGSGSTMIACEKLGRRCFMMEISEIYCSVIIARWQNFTGQKAIKL